ncbi:MAG TPA: hypothetical protein PKG59_11315, partial [Spirochaetota bacterium]|nr:hypothetical protein [Spirochaetota bacterium]
KGSYVGSCVPVRDLPRYIALYREGRLPVDRLMSDRLALEDINADLTEKLNMIVEVMENNDIISLTDILEYEIKPAFEGLGRYIDELLKAL